MLTIRVIDEHTVSNDKVRRDLFPVCACTVPHEVYGSILPHPQ